MRRLVIHLINRLAAIGDGALTAAFPSTPDDLTGLAEAVGAMRPADDPSGWAIDGVTARAMFHDQLEDDALVDEYLALFASGEER